MKLKVRSTIKPGSHDVINIIVVAVKTSNTCEQYPRNHRRGNCEHGANLISSYKQNSHEVLGSFASALVTAHVDS